MIYKNRKLKLGDILIDEDGDKTKVLGVLTNLVGLSIYNHFEEFRLWYTAKELEDWGLDFSESEKWVPKHKEDYWFKQSDGRSFLDFNSNRSIDIFRIKIGNCFKTKEEADAAEVTLPAIKQ